LEKGEYSPSLATVQGLYDVLEVSPVTLVALVEPEFISGDPALLGKLAEEELDEMGSE